MVWKVCVHSYLWVHGLTPSPPRHGDQLFNLLFAFRVSSQGIYSVTLSWQTEICDWELVNDGHAPAPLWAHWCQLCPDFLHQHYGERLPPSDTQRVPCYLLGFQLSALLLPLHPHCQLYMEDDSIACYLLTRKRGLLSLKEPMLQVWEILKIFFLENILCARYCADIHEHTPGEQI